MKQLLTYSGMSIFLLFSTGSVATEKANCLVASNQSHGYILWSKLIDNVIVIKTKNQKACDKFRYCQMYFTTKDDPCSKDNLKLIEQFYVQEVKLDRKAVSEALKK